MHQVSFCTLFTLIFVKFFLFSIYSLIYEFQANDLRIRLILSFIKFGYFICRLCWLLEVCLCISTSLSQGRLQYEWWLWHLHDIFAQIGRRTGAHQVWWTPECHHPCAVHLVQVWVVRGLILRISSHWWFPWSEDHKVLTWSTSTVLDFTL